MTNCQVSEKPKIGPDTIQMMMLAAAIIFYDWRWALALFGARLIIQGVIFYRAMKKLDEADLWPLYFFFDLWMFLYYIIFAPALWRKPAQSWN